MMDPAGELNERDTFNEKDEKELANECGLPLDLELSEQKADEIFPYAEADWNDPEQTEIDKRVRPKFLFDIEIRQRKRG